MAIPGKLHARSFRCLWVLEELGVRPFEVCMLIHGQPYAPQMREYGMLQATKLPALLMNGKEIGESSVICQILAESFQSEKQLLGEDDERVERMQWMGFAETFMMLRVPYLATLMDPSSHITTIQNEVIEPQKQIIENNIEYFEAHFKDRQTPYLLRSGFSIADVMCGFSLNTFSILGVIALNPTKTPLTFEYLQRLRARPAFERTEKYAELAPGPHTQE